MKSGTLVNIGTLHLSEKQSELAIRYFCEARDISLKTDDPIGIIETEYKLAQLYEESGQIETARKYYQHAHFLSQSIGFDLRGKPMIAAYANFLLE